MNETIYFSHGVFFVYDEAEQVPGNDWSDTHVEQHFSRRAESANISTILAEGVADLRPGTPELLDTCNGVVAVSVLSRSGAVAISGCDPEDTVIWNGPPGWVRVTVGQKPGEREQHVTLVCLAEKAVDEQATRVREDGEWMSGPFLETSLPIKL